MQSFVDGARNMKIVWRETGRGMEYWWWTCFPANGTFCCWAAHLIHQCQKSPLGCSERIIIDQDRTFLRIERIYYFLAREKVLHVNRGFASMKICWMSFNVKYKRCCGQDCLTYRTVANLIKDGGQLDTWFVVGQCLGDFLVFYSIGKVA